MSSIVLLYRLIRQHWLLWSPSSHQLLTFYIAALAHSETRETRINQYLLNIFPFFVCFLEVTILGQDLWSYGMIMYKAIYCIKSCNEKMVRFFLSAITVILFFVKRGNDDVPKVSVYSEEGYLVQTWKTTTIEMPHGIFALSTSNGSSVWITDIGNGAQKNCCLTWKKNAVVLCFATEVYFGLNFKLRCCPSLKKIGIHN